MITNLDIDGATWQSSNAADNLSCVLGEYILRVSQLYKGLWLWSVTHKGEKLPVKEDTTNSKYRAIGLAEGLYLGHKAKQLQFKN